MQPSKAVWPLNTEYISLYISFYYIYIYIYICMYTYIYIYTRTVYIYMKKRYIYIYMYASKVCTRFRCIYVFLGGGETQSEKIETYALK